jgi:hypothetical protein
VGHHAAGLIVFASPRRDGTITLKLDPVVRTVIGQVCSELRAHLEAEVDDPALRRLFPTAYPDDAARERAYESLVRDDLLRGRFAALDTVQRTVDSDTITRDEAEQWLTAINAVRLTLGTRLDVSEDDNHLDLDPEDPRHTQYVVYDLLGVLLGSIVAALSGD